MHADTQIGLMGRIKAHQQAGKGTDVAEASMVVDTGIYTSPDRLAAERRMLASQPTLVGLSGLIARPGDFATVDVGGSSVILTRGADGTANAVLNACRHRGAQLKEGCGTARKLVCPYHGWSYALDGAALHRRREQFFDDTPADALVRLPVRESDGLLWVSADPSATIPEQPLAGAEAELAPFDLGGYVLFDRTEFTRPLNWKLAIDTFCEAYHVGTLHQTTIAPLIHSDFAVFDTFGPHGRMIAARRSIDGVPEQPRSGWDLLPHATILYFLVPGAVLVHQQDHIELYQSRPGTHPGEAHLTVSVYVPSDSERPERYWRKNFDLLVHVTDTEDFTTASGMQRSFESGGLPKVVFGRNEPGLQHFHRSLEQLLLPGPGATPHAAPGSPSRPVSR